MHEAAIATCRADEGLCPDVGTGRAEPVHPRISPARGPDVLAIQADPHGGFERADFIIPKTGAIAILGGAFIPADYGHSSLLLGYPNL